MARADANIKVLADWVAKTPWVDFLAEDPAIRSNTSVCMKIVDPAVTSLSADAQADSPRSWSRCSRRKAWATISRLPRRAAGPAHLVRRHGRGERCRGAAPWLDWAWAETKATLAKAA